MTADLLGLEETPPRDLDRKEAAASVEVMRALRTHPAVASCEHMNSGAARIGGRFVRFGWPGCPDLLGQLKDGRLMGCEVKAPAGKLRAEQAVFWSASVVLVAWHLLPVTAPTFGANLKASP